MFNRTAADELNDHFTQEAALIRYAASNVRNLQSAVKGETYEWTTMYPGLAATAATEGCTVAAQLSTEIAKDEKAHADAYGRALKVLTTGRGTVPPPPTVAAAPFRATSPACSGKTLANLQTAMKGESFANASYTLYARHAAATGQRALARLFARQARVAGTTRPRGCSPGSATRNGATRRSTGPPCASPRHSACPPLTANGE